MTRLFACLNGRCPVIYFKTRDGRCECGEVGYRVAWALKPPRWHRPDN